MKITQNGKGIRITRSNGAELCLEADEAKELKVAVDKFFKEEKKKEVVIKPKIDDKTSDK